MRKRISRGGKFPRLERKASRAFCYAGHTRKDARQQDFIGADQDLRPQRFTARCRLADQSLNRTVSCETKYAVRSRLAPRLSRFAIVFLTVVAWLVASDHCALAGVLLRPVAAPAAQESCPGHSPEGEKKPSQGELPCCKTLVAAPAPAKISAGYDLSFFVLQPYLAAAFQLAFEKAAAPGVELDTGPPEIRTFAESVLQRSLLAHAPPLLG